jgi:hypothetical protein
VGANIQQVYQYGSSLDSRTSGSDNPGLMTIIRASRPDTTNSVFC